MCCLGSYILNRGRIDRSSKCVLTFDKVTAGAASKAPNNNAAAVKVEDTMGGDELLDEDKFDEVVEP